ncbi:hypothetical protein NMG60_11035371 [Bertholletia excelsa]
MEKDSNKRYVFPLTSLQIGDLQSYLSHLNLFLAPDSKKLYILVDNRPWLKDLGPRSAHLWQLMVTKSRLSPFANTKAQKERKERGEVLELKSSPISNTSKPKKYRRWLSLVNNAAALSHERALLPVKKLRNSLTLNSKLHRTLYGFIVFEVAWSDVRGINYLNELQTDTSLAIEAKFMKRWEFDSIAQAANCILSWFPGTYNEQLVLKEYLNSITGDVFYDAKENFPIDGDFVNDENICNEDLYPGIQSPCSPTDSFDLYPARMESEASMQHTPPPPDGPYKRRKVIRTRISGFSDDIFPEETHSEIVESPMHSQTSYASDCEDAVEATENKDVLILFRFDDRDLPFELKKIIMSDLRLLTLLEAGLPPWVIFLQSYPGFCHLYRPWMCPLARTLYVLISLVTVIIGFYDLYKNVPVLKATASRLCGPLFSWIETWEMKSRIKYLGTMLFLHNFEKAVKWFLMITRTLRTFISVLTQPMAVPLMFCFNITLPLWTTCVEIMGSFGSVIWFVIDSSFNLVENLVEIVLLPVWFILSTIWKIAKLIVYPVFWILWEILYAPIRLVVGLSGFSSFIFTCVYDLVRDMSLFISGITKLTSQAEATVSTTQVSMWRSLWNDLFSQIFRAVRSILYGFAAFFAACNRHRLSIYNHTLEFIQRLSQPTQRIRNADSRHGGCPYATQNSPEPDSKILKLTGPHGSKPRKDHRQLTSSAINF